MLPKDDRAYIASNFIATEFPGQESNPIEIVFPNGARQTAQIAIYAAELASVPGIVRVGESQVVGESARLVAIHSMPPRTPEAEQLIKSIREIAAPEGTLVGGIAADYADTQGAISRTLPAVGLWIVIAVLLLLFFFTGSILLPIKAIILNFASLAAAVSVLTERRRFNGSLEDFDAARKEISLPMLRKDFMVDEYQFYEARAHGADLILLIVAGLSKSQLADYYALATELGMKSLIEVHTNDELEAAMEINPEIVGVNSRNLKTLEVDPAVFKDLIPRLPNNVIKVAESGISTRADVLFAEEAGANVILVGEALVKAGDPIKGMAALLGRQ